MTQRLFFHCVGDIMELLVVAQLCLVLETNVTGLIIKMQNLNALQVAFIVSFKGWSFFQC